MTFACSKKITFAQRVCSLLLSLVILLSVACVSVSAQPIEFDDSNLHTDSVLLVNTKTGDVLYEKQSDTQREIASVVKIMTAIMALENIKNPESYMIEVTQKAVDDIVNQDASTAGFEHHVGESFKALDVIYGLMLPSGCECSQILAYEVGGSEENFAKMMNNKAKELGCENTYFEEAHGLSDKNYSTASDVAIIAQYAMKNELFSKIVATEFYQIEGFDAPIFNTNALIGEQTNTGYYNKYITGVKTGFTTKAKRCLVSTSKKGDDEFMCVVLGSLNRDRNYAFVDSLSLHNFALENFTDNIDVDILREFASVKKGKSISLDISADENAQLVWSSSNESVATVSKDGVVCAKADGQVKITAMTQSGNFDTAMVSVGFENGIDVTSRYGDYTTGDKQPIDWKAVKNSGFDFAVIRAGWGSEDYPNQNDAQFVTNVQGAFENDVPYYLSFIAYAQSEQEALAEADYFLREMEEYFPTDCKGGLKDIIYNMTYSPYQSNDKQLNTNIALAFAERIKQSGYNTLIFANKAVYKNLDVKTLTQKGIGTYYSYYPYVVDFDTQITMPDGTTPDMWQYRSDGYYPSASENGFSKLCIAYIKYDRYDVNRDGKVSILDATYIQLVIAKKINADDEQMLDVNSDGKLSIIDATHIQRHLVKLEV